MVSTCGQGLSQGFCGVKDVQMVELNGVITVLKGTPLTSTLSRGECVSFCLKTCSCAAVVFSDDQSQRGCFHYELVGGVKEVKGGTGVNYFVKVARNATDGEEDTINIKRMLLIVIGTVDGLAILVILGGLVCYFVIRYRKKDSNTRTDQDT